MVFGKAIRMAGALLACAGICALLAQPAYAADAALTVAPSGETQSDRLVFNAENLQAAAQLPAPDELFAGHVQQKFAEAGQSGAGALHAQKVTRGSFLTGSEAIVYDVLVERICDIAAGRESNGIVTIPASAFGMKKTYTAAELGLDTVFDPEAPGRISQEAKSALVGRLGLVMPRILNAALNDFPYELYWFDKTLGIVFEPPELCAFADDAGGTVGFVDSSVATFSMYVSADYSPLREIGACTADTAKTSAASKAAQAARAIVAEHAGESDYEKLHSYLCAVAKLTDYNRDAESSSEAVSIYGDPWQVIYVFDGDPATKVVCEGYSKAFQYLCDLSAFSDPSIACNSVSGDMLGGKGAGAHMWNIVAIGSKNYLVDVTNNDNFPDEGATDPAVASRDELFLAGAYAVERSGRAGYRIDWTDATTGTRHWIEYYYDQETRAFFSAAELALSTTSCAVDLAGGGGSDPVPQASDEERAAHVSALIASIGEVSFDARSARAIEEARTAYDALNDVQKALVKNVFALVNAETRYALLKLDAEEAAAQAETDKEEPAAIDPPTKVKPAVKVTILTLNVAKMTKTAVAKALKKAGAKSSAIKKVVLSSKVKRISKGAFSTLKKAKTLVVKTKKLKKSVVSGCLSKSKVTTVSVRVGSAKANKSYAKKYKKLFIKKVVGKKVRLA